MSDSLASWITLSALLLSAGIIHFRNPQRSANGIAMNLLSATLCFFGGFLVAGLVMKLAGGIDNQIASSVIVVAGSLACVGGREYLTGRRRIS